MDVTQVYVFSGPRFVRQANEFLRAPEVRRALMRPKIRCDGTFIAVIAEIGWMAVDELWQVYVRITEVQQEAR